MLTLYYKPTCPFCRQVLAVVDRLELEVDMKDVTSDKELVDELLDKGGKNIVPYLVDTDKDVAMYESEDIVKHLQDNYGEATPAKPRVHISDAACLSCEG